ncbi:hypothetical protein FHS18_003389 [Paenibacillus phyllosphaerae]|uniref:Uncharacterized protein n=1 Tax=Paenibacillus phyllosphaerae TaxID=274593 RepID=A0A7W5B093_9BACL|nr:hypothetical protein [Paenibacillus phyllosphaerae]MBB3111321.1 hypothetical protein [Paenibacillus phyllosphaerae]
MNYGNIRVSVLGFEQASCNVVTVYQLAYLHSLLLETRIDRLETFMRKQKKTPAIYINYVFANRLEDEAKSIMEQLMLKYKQPEKHHSNEKH